MDQNNNPLSVAGVIKKADDRLYRTLVFAPLIARLVYFLAVAIFAVAGFVLATRWDISELKKNKADKSAVQSNVEHIERNAKIMDQIYRDVYKREPPPR